MQLFLSFNSADRTSVIGVQKLLQARGITTFLDHDNLASGLAWPHELEHALRAVDGVAVFIGCELGGWQKREMWFALDRQVREEKEGRAFPVIPVLLQGADLTPGFLFLNTWIDLRRGLDGVFAAEALNAFERAIKATEPVRDCEDSAARVAERAAAICPYRGLQVFREEDAAFFVGRKALAEQLLDFTLGKNLVAVVGPSGSGKSSVVQAGLLPLLRRERPPANTWDAVSFTPGHDPFHRLASALIPLLEPNLRETARLLEAEELGRNLAANRTRVEAVINRVIERSNGTGRLLLVADQFEELFTLTPERDRRPFAQALLHARRSAPVTALVTLRADFYSQIITLDRELSDVLAPAQVNIGALTPDELRESITAPARLVGLEFEPGLINRILTDIGSEPGRLPLVEFALTEIWERRKGRLLTNGAYDEIGGVTGALARRTEAEFARLNPEEQAGARRLFSRLVHVARPEEAGQDTRQRTELSDADTLAKRVAKQLADARLLVTGSEAGTGTIWVEVAHEALIRNWERLRGWLNEDREFLLWRERLGTLLTEWVRAQESDAALLRGPLLIEAQKWFDQRSQDLSDQERKFISVGQAMGERQVREERERQEREIESARTLAEEQKRRAEAARKLRRRAIVAAGAAAAALILLALSVATWREDEFERKAAAEARDQADVGVILETQGELQQALDAYQESLKTRQTLAEHNKSNTVWQQDLAAGCDTVGRVFWMLGRRQEALDAYQRSLAIRRTLAEQNKSHHGWQRDLAASYNQIGYILEAQDQLQEALDAYQQALAIVKRLAEQGRSNAVWQNDLFVSYTHVGSVLEVQGNLPLALDSYRQKLALAKRLAEQDKSNAGWQHNLSVSYNKVGDVLSAQGKLQEALDAYQQSLAISKRLAEQDKSNAGWQLDLIVSLCKVGTTTAKMGAHDSLSQAQEFLRTALNLADKYSGQERQQLIDGLNRELQKLVY